MRYLLSLLLVAASCGGDDDVLPMDSGVMEDTSIRIGPDGGDASRDAQADAQEDVTGSTLDAGEISDAAPATCPGACDPVRGSCAAGACVLAGSAPSCVPSGGALLEGMPCEELGQCAAGLACFRDERGGVCGRICCPAAAVADRTCGQDRRCSESAVLVDGTPTSYGRCIAPRPDCDVLDPSTCGVGEACYIVSPEGAVDCRAAGLAQAGAECVDIDDCMPGFTCAGILQRVCARICRVGSSDRACPLGEGFCQEYAQSPPGTGLCTPEAMSRP